MRGAYSEVPGSSISPMAPTAIEGGCELGGAPFGVGTSKGAVFPHVYRYFFNQPTTMRLWRRPLAA